MIHSSLSDLARNGAMKTQTLSASRAGLGSVIVDDSTSLRSNSFIAHVGVANAGPLIAAIQPSLIADAETFHAPSVAAPGAAQSLARSAR
jgi:hypothetical protein